MRYALVSGIAALIILLDQLSKMWVVKTLPLHAAVPVVDGFFNLVHIYNRGAAFGFLNRSDIEWQFWLFLGATFIAVVAIFHLVRTSSYFALLFVALGLILGGALGNMIDRIRYRAVVDFLDFYVGTWHWPAFNVADIAICVGAGLTCLAMYITEKQDKKKTSNPKKV